jgi:hypothetical protein
MQPKGPPPEAPYVDSLSPVSTPVPRGAPARYSAVGPRKYHATVGQEERPPLQIVPDVQLQAVAVQRGLVEEPGDAVCEISDFGPGAQHPRTSEGG